MDELTQDTLEVFRACLPRRRAKAKNDRLFLEAVHSFTIHNVTWRALPEHFGKWNSVWKRSGLCLFVKRLEDGKFKWPRIEDGAMRLSAAQLSALVEGLDWTRLHVRRTPKPQAVQ